MFTQDYTPFGSSTTLLSRIVHSHTRELHRYLLMFLSRRYCTNQQPAQAHHIAKSEISSLHRSLRPQLNNKPTICVPRLLISSDGGRLRLCCSTLVSPAPCNSRVLHRHHAVGPPKTSSLHQPLHLQCRLPLRRLGQRQPEHSRQ